MKNWKRRIKTAWQVLIGQKRLLTDAATRVVYVQDSGPEGKLVQLVPWRDMILGLDNRGSIWMLSSDFNAAYPTIQMWMQEPTVRR